MPDLGDRIKVRVSYAEKNKAGSWVTSTVSLPAEVVWIHPARRFFTVLVTLPNGFRFRTTQYFVAN